jgi:hypothetical protein
LGSDYGIVAGNLAVGAVALVLAAPVLYLIFIYKEPFT